MSVTLDVNVLLYASDAASQYRDRAIELIDEAARGPQLVYLFWPTVIGYLRMATHPAIFAAPLSLEEARTNVSRLIGQPTVQTVGEGEGFWNRLTEVLNDAAPIGNLVSDAHMVALMQEHGVRTVWTRDRDYRRFDGIRAVDPFA
ncbi:MAG: TA system VapC family ribonuclease toxin [Candidatus Limnocylindria bacterium]